MPFRPPLELACSASLRYLADLEEAPVSATASLDELRARLGRPLPVEGMAAERVVEELLRDVEGGLIGSAGGRFFGWVIGGALPSSLAADWLASTWDQNAGLYAAGPAAAVVEEVAGGWLKEVLGLPAGASFAFVTGCQMAHTTCLAAARHAVLERRGWDVEQQGLWGAPAVRVVTSAERHGTIERALRLLGMGRNCVVDIEADEQGRLSPRALEAALDDGPAIVLLQAGDLNIGAYDPFEELIEIAHRRGAWAHVDGAFGLWANASLRYRHLLRGVERADSWATDGHKWLNVPYDSGYAFVADAAAHRAAMSYRASYLTHDEAARDQLDWTPEWSRRARGFATYAALRELGRRGIAEVVERCCARASAIVRGIGALRGAEVVWAPQINQGLLTFGDDARTDAVIAAIVSSGEAFFGGTTWRGRRCMRVSVCNWQTSEEDVERAVAAVGRALSEHAAEDAEITRSNPRSNQR
jgi:glutamate/tyrosine decarboxylase-like PLP-dependent enzyme